MAQSPYTIGIGVCHDTHIPYTYDDERIEIMLREIFITDERNPLITFSYELDRRRGHIAFDEPIYPDRSPKEWALGHRLISEGPQAALEYLRGVVDAYFQRHPEDVRK